MTQARFYARLTPIFLAGALMIACDDGGLAQLTASAVFEPDTIDFGEVTVDTTAEMPVSLKNTGSLPFIIESVERPEGFMLSPAKDAIEGLALPAGRSEQLTVTFIAREEGLREGQIKVRTAAGVEAVLNVRAMGVVRRLPELVLEPDTLDFGTIEIGGDARLQVTVKNNGNASGTITGATLESTNMTATDAAAQYSVSTALPLTVGEGSQQTMEIVYRSLFEGARPDRIIFTVDGTHPPLILNLKAVGLVARGALVCNPSNVNFGPHQRGTVAQQQVHCEARGGGLRLIGAGFPAGTQYFALPTPVGTADLNDGQGIDIAIEFRPDGLPGLQTASLLVNYNGASGAQTVTIPINGEVTPPPPTSTAISAVLRWNTNNSDIDLHLVRPGGSTFATNGSDCFYAEMAPDWGRVGDQADDPFLDVDNTQGFGPENINLTEAAPGAYEVWIHSFRDSPSVVTRATVEVFVAGVQAGTFTHDLTCQQIWLVGTVQWNGTSGTFSPSATVQPSTRGYCL
ncbi:MAG: choice-of-anchor D domain-containing protein [Deltaproteobacteria bacterium]|nr:choice-of-anchor D domain-containing protein [Deltaproteobacteria bacterium]